MSSETDQADVSAAPNRELGRHADRHAEPTRENGQHGRVAPSMRRICVRARHAVATGETNTSRPSRHA